MIRDLLVPLVGLVFASVGVVRAHDVDLVLANVRATPSPITYSTSGGLYTTLLYEFTLTNNGPDATAASRFTFTAPVGTFVPYFECIRAAGTGDCDTLDASHGNNRAGAPGGNTFTLSNISLNSGARLRMVIRVYVNSALSAASVSASASVAGDETDPNLANNSWSTAVTATADTGGTNVQFRDEVRAFTGAADTTVTPSAWTGFAQNNDVLLAWVMLRNATAGEVFNTPSGWRKLGSTVTRNDVRLALFYRRYTTGDPTSWTFTTTQSGFLGAVVSVYAGVGTANPVSFATSSRDGTCSVGTQSNGEQLANTYANWNSPCYLNHSIEGARAMPLNLLATGGKVIAFIADATGDGAAYSSRDASGLVWRRANSNYRSGATEGISYANLDRDVVVAGSTDPQALFQTAGSPQGSPIAIQIALCSGAADCGGGTPADTAVTVSGLASPAGGYVQGSAASWTAVVTHSGGATTGVGVGFGLPPGVSGLSWTCVAGAGGTCAAASGTSAGTTADFAATGTVTYTFAGTVAATTYGAIEPAVSLTAGSAADSTSSNNLAQFSTPMKLANFLVTPASGGANACGGTMDYTVTARDSSNAVITAFAGNVAVKSTIVGDDIGDWSGTSVTDGASGNGAIAGAAFSAGSATARLTVGSSKYGAGTVTATGGVITGTHNSVLWQVGGSSFTITAADANLPGNVVVAGRPHRFVVRLNDGCSPSGAPVYNPANIKVKITTSANHTTHTATAAMPRVMTHPGVGGPLLDTSSYASVSASFAASDKTWTINLYPADVGQYTIDMLDDSGGYAPASPGIVGSSVTVTARPFALHLPPIWGNPEESTGSGAVFVAAGDDFVARATGKTWSAAHDTEPAVVGGNAGNGVPEPGSNLTLVPTLSYLQPVDEATEFSAGTTFYPTVGVAGVVNNGAAVAFSGGFQRTLQYTEVGSFYLRARGTKFLGVATLFEDTGGLLVGRFKAASLVVTSNTPRFQSYCGVGGTSGPAGFSYVGQKFGYATAPVITVEAKNALGATVTKYRGDWFRVPMSALTGRAYSASPATLDTSGLPATVNEPAINATDGTLTFSHGSGLFFTRGAAQAPFNAEISLAVTLSQDSDGAPFPAAPIQFGAASAGNGIAFSADKEMVWGQIDFSGAPYAATITGAFLTVPVTLSLSRATGAGTTAFADPCFVSMAQTDFALESFSGGLAACEMAVGPAAVGVVSSATTVTMNIDGPVAVGDVGAVSVRARLDSAGGTTCTVRSGLPVAASALGRGYLGADPNATVTFSSAPATVARRRVYIREQY